MNTLRELAESRTQKMHNIAPEELFTILDPKYVLKRTHDEDKGTRWLREGGWPPGFVKDSHSDDQLQKSNLSQSSSQVSKCK
jgi:hypothetical protein